MNLDSIKVKLDVNNDIINHTLFNHIDLPKDFRGNTGYISFLNKNTFIVNVENDYYYSKKNKKINLPTFYDINVLCVSNLFLENQIPKTSLVLEKSLTRMAHNMCIFKSKDGTSFFGIAGRYDIKQPDRWKKYEITQDKGLYLVSTQSISNKPWDIMNNKNPIIGRDTLSNFKKPASYDSQISCIYSTLLQKYIMVVRNNIGREQRYFSVLFSDDCINWSKFTKPTLNPPYEPKSGNQYYSLILHEYLPKQLILGFALFYNQKQNIYGIKLLISQNGIQWRDAGLLFKVPKGIMPRNHYIRPKIHCGGVETNDRDGRITLYFYKYKEKNNIQYFSKTYRWEDLIQL